MTDSTTTTAPNTSPSSRAKVPKSRERAAKERDAMAPTLTPEGVESVREALSSKGALAVAIDCDDYTKATDVYAAGLSAAVNDLRLLFIATDEEATIPFDAAQVNLAVRGIMRRLEAVQELAEQAELSADLEPRAPTPRRAKAASASADTQARRERHVRGDAELRVAEKQVDAHLSLIRDLELRDEMECTADVSEMSILELALAAAGSNEPRFALDSLAHRVITQLQILEEVGSLVRSNNHSTDLTIDDIRHEMFVLRRQTEAIRELFARAEAVKAGEVAA